MADTNLKTILSDLYSITSGTWGKLSGYNIKSFESSDAISGNVDANGVLKLGVNVSDLVDTGDVTNALKVKNNGLYVGLPLAQNGSFGLVKAGTGVTIADGILSVSLDGVGSADAVANSLTVFGTAWNGSSELSLKIADNDNYLKATKSGNIISISSQNIGENSETTNYLTGKTIVWDGLRALDSEIKTVKDSIPVVPEYSIKKATNAETGYAATYQLTKDGVAIGDKINIIKDQFLKDAELIVADTTDATLGIESGKSYIKFTFELSTDGDVTGEEDSTKEIYLDASSLVNVEEISQVRKVADLSSVDTSSYKTDALLFTEDGETAIYDHESKTIRDCSEETVEEITEETLTSLVPTVGAVSSYIEAKKSEFGTANIEKVDSIPETYTSNKNTILFTEDGETALYSTELNKVIDISDETVSLITSTTDTTAIPNVGAVTGYFESFNTELEELKGQFAALKLEIEAK